MELAWRLTVENVPAVWFHTPVQKVKVVLEVDRTVELLANAK